MSLLLQALQKAAKSRGDGSTPEHDASTAPQEPTFELDAAPPAEEPREEELRLADDLIEPEMAPEPQPEFEPVPPATPARLGSMALRSTGFGAGPTAAQAATILRASETRSAGWIDWARDRPVHAFAVLAAIFLVFYGAYVYLQIFHPAVLRGDFSFFSTPAPKPMARPRPPAPISQAPDRPVAAPTTPAPAAAPPAATPAAAPSAASPNPARAAKPATAEPAPLAGMPQARAPRGEATPERAQPSRPRVPRESTTRQATAVPSVPLVNPMEDTVAVRQPEAPAATSAALMRAWEALQAGRFVEALTLYHKVEQAEPYNVDAMLGLAAIATQNGNAEEATRYYTRALELEPRNATAQAGLIALLGQADPQVSESRLKLLLAREPSANVYFALGTLYSRQALWPQAQQAYFQAYQLQPDNPDYAYNLAVGLEHLNQPKLALTYYQKALELAGQRGHASFETLRVEERIGQLTARVGSN